MTEKRFIPVFAGYEPHRLIGAKDNGKIITFEDMFDLLNSLSEENERLKHDIKCLELFAKNSPKIYEENQKLKQAIEQLKDALNQRTEQCDKYYEENEQLKQQNDFLTTQLAELSTYMMALGYDIELEFEDGRVIKLNEELKGDVE